MGNSVIPTVSDPFQVGIPRSDTLRRIDRLNLQQGPTMKQAEPYLPLPFFYPSPPPPDLAAKQQEYLQPQVPKSQEDSLLIFLLRATPNQQQVHLHPPKNPSPTPIEQKKYLQAQAQEVDLLQWAPEEPQEENWWEVSFPPSTPEQQQAYLNPKKDPLPTPAEPQTEEEDPWKGAAEEPQDNWGDFLFPTSTPGQQQAYLNPKKDPLPTPAEPQTEEEDPWKGAAEEPQDNWGDFLFPTSTPGQQQAYLTPQVEEPDLSPPSQKGDSKTVEPHVTESKEDQSGEFSTTEQQQSHLHPQGDPLSIPAEPQAAEEEELPSYLMNIKSAMAQWIGPKDFTEFENKYYIRASSKTAQRVGSFPYPDDIIRKFREIRDIALPVARVRCKQAKVDLTAFFAAARLALHRCRQIAEEVFEFADNLCHDKFKMGKTPVSKLMVIEYLQDHWNEGLFDEKKIGQLVFQEKLASLTTEIKAQQALAQFATAAARVTWLMVLLQDQEALFAEADSQWFEPVKQAPPVPQEEKPKERPLYIQKMDDRFQEWFSAEDEAKLRSGDEIEQQEYMASFLVQLMFEAIQADSLSLVRKTCLDHGLSTSSINETIKHMLETSQRVAEEILTFAKNSMKDILKRSYLDDHILQHIRNNYNKGIFNDAEVYEYVYQQTGAKLNPDMYAEQALRQLCQQIVTPAWHAVHLGQQQAIFARVEATWFASAPAPSSEIRLGEGETKTFTPAPSEFQPEPPRSLGPKTIKTKKTIPTEEKNPLPPEVPKAEIETPAEEKKKQKKKKRLKGIAEESKQELLGKLNTNAGVFKYPIHEWEREFKNRGWEEDFYKVRDLFANTDVAFNLITKPKEFLNLALSQSNVIDFYRVLNINPSIYRQNPEIEYQKLHPELVLSRAREILKAGVEELLLKCSALEDYAFLKYISPDVEVPIDSDRVDTLDPSLRKAWNVYLNQLVDKAKKP